MSKVKELQIAILESLEKSAQNLPEEWTKDMYWLESHEVEEDKLPF